MLSVSEQRCLNRDHIKYLAIAAMFLNHLSYAVFPETSAAGEILKDIGYFTAVTMCYFLTEGYRYTRSKKKYGQRLLIFGVISQIPFLLLTGYFMLNMMFTLFFCFLILVVREKIYDPHRRIILQVLLVLMTTICDWAWLAPVFTIMFDWAKGDREKEKKAYINSFLLFLGFNLLSLLNTVPLYQALLRAFGASLGIGVSAAVILYFYNGKPSGKRSPYSKWFFYIFYPVHLLVLGGIRLFFLK